MKEIGNKSRMSENTPLTTSPLMKNNKYNRITPFWNQLLLVTAPDITSLDQQIKRYLKQIQTILISLPSKATKISSSYYLEEVNRLMETTSSDPPDTTLAMVKTKATDPELCEIG